MNKDIGILSFDGLCEVEDDIYLSNNMFNGLMKMSKGSKEITLLNQFPIGPVYSRLLHHQPIKYKNEIIFVPHFSHGVHIYNLDTHETIYIPVKKDDWKNFRCVDSIIWNGKLWMILTYFENSIASMDLKTKKIEYYADMYHPLCELKDELMDGVVFWSLLAKTDYVLYGVVDNSGYIIQIDLMKLKIKLLKVDDKKRFLDIALWKNCFYLTQYNSKDIVVYDNKNGLCHEIENKYDEILSDDGVVYSNIFALADAVVLVSNNGERIYTLNNDQISCLGVVPKGFKDIKADTRATWKRFYCYSVCDNKIKLFPSRANMMVSIEINERKISGQILKMSNDWLNTIYPNEYIKGYISECVSQKVPSYECDVVSLIDYVSNV